MRSRQRSWKVPIDSSALVLVRAAPRWDDAPDRGARAASEAFKQPARRQRQKDERTRQMTGDRARGVCAHANVQEARAEASSRIDRRGASAWTGTLEARAASRGQSEGRAPLVPVTLGKVSVSVARLRPARRTAQSARLPTAFTRCSSQRRHVQNQRCANEDAPERPSRSCPPSS